MAPLVEKMDAERPMPPANREKLEKAIELIDAVNAQDPTVVDFEGQSHPYRLLYSKWVTEWVKKLDPKARDELLILARGRSVESWLLKNIDRNNFPPNLGGVRMWQAERRKWQANRLTSIMKEAGYEDESIKLVEEIMLDRDIPDPQDIRQFDLKGPLGTTNFRLLEEACMVQTLRDAEALVFMERNFPAMADNLSADEVLKVIKRELALISQKCIRLLLDMPWTTLQRKLVGKAFPTPRSYSMMVKEMEGVAAASTHPGDWRYRNFDYD